MFEPCHKPIGSCCFLASHNHSQVETSWQSSAQIWLKPISQLNLQEFLPHFGSRADSSSAQVVSQMNLAEIWPISLPARSTQCTCVLVYLAANLISRTLWLTARHCCTVEEVGHDVFDPLQEHIHIPNARQSIYERLCSIIMKILFLGNTLQLPENVRLYFE